MPNAEHHLLDRAQDLLLRACVEDASLDAGRRVVLAASSSVIDELRAVVGHLDDAEIARDTTDSLLRATVSLWMVAHARCATARPIEQVAMTLRNAVERAVMRAR